MDKFCLKWDDFEKNVGDVFRKFWDDQRLFDVTLATEDEQHIQAHKIILSAGSSFFSNIFLKNNDANMLIYLKGIKSGQLQPVIDFLYKGETFVTNEELPVFFETGKELQIKGLESGFMDKQEPLTVLEKAEKSDAMGHKKEENIFDPYSVADEITEIVNIDENGDEYEYAYNAKHNWKNTIPDEPDYAHGYSVVKMNAKKVSSNTNNEIDLQILEIIEKKEGLWHCKVCVRTASRKSHIQEHAESHIEGMLHPCYICDKTFRLRKSVREHQRKYHASLLELF